MTIRPVVFLILCAPCFAQIDLPDKPVRPPEVTPAVTVPPPPRGNLAERVTGAKAEKEALEPKVDLPAEALPAPATVLPTAAAAGGALEAAASFIYAEVARPRADPSVVEQAVHSLLNLGEPGLRASRAAIDSNRATTIDVAARVLLSSGGAADAELVLMRMRGRLPAEACGPLVRALAEVDPVRAPPKLFVELLGHAQAPVRAAAGRELASLPPTALAEVLPQAFALRVTDARLRAVALAGGCTDARALDLLVGALGDPSAEVGRKAVEVLAAREDERLESLLLRSAFDGRWLLRENAFALLALIAREDLAVKALLGPEHVDSLLGGLRSADIFVSGTSAAALAGVGFRSPAGPGTAWLDKEVPAQLVHTLSGVEFHNDISALQPAALRRLSLISGQGLGTDGRRWVEWWAGARESFSALRAVLSASPDEAAGMRLDYLASSAAPSAFRLLGQAERAAAGAPPVERSLILSDDQAAEYFELLRREQVLEAARLPGTRGTSDTPSRGTRTLEVALGGRSKVFRFRGDASEPWFERLMEGARALYERNRWQLYLEPGVETSSRDAFQREGAWWQSEHTAAERDGRLKERILVALRVRPVSEREEGLSELKRIASRSDCLAQADFEVLRGMLREERFFSDRSRTLTELCLAAAGRDEQGHVLQGQGTLLIGDLEENFGSAAAGEIERVLLACDPDAVRAAALDPRALLRAIAAGALGRAPDTEGNALLMALLDDDDPRVEAAAVLALGLARVEAARTEILIRARIGETDVRCAALIGIGHLGGAGALDVLTIALGERDAPQICEAAARGLAALADPSTASLLVTLLGSADDEGLVTHARMGLLALGSDAWPDLLRAVRTPGHHARREAALLLSRQAVPEALPALIQVLADAPDDGRVAAELAVLSSIDMRAEADPAVAWWTWWSEVVHDDPLAWFLGALARAGREVPTPESLSVPGNASGALFLVSVMADAPPHQQERARRELARLLARDVEPAPIAGAARDAWLAKLNDEVALRYR
jgi:HEAT repeat protein